MNLREEDLLVGTVQSAPDANPALEGPQLPVLEAARVAPLQFLEDGQGFQAWGTLEQLLSLRPNLGERVLAGAPMADLAQRRFMMVNPSNRLVANTLEADWNDKLRVLAKAREERER